MKATVYRPGFYTLQIVTRTRRQMKWESINIETGERRESRYRRLDSEAGFAEDIEINSQPTHPRCAVLVIEKP